MKKINANKPRKIRMCVFLDPALARKMKLQAARLGYRGVSELFTRLYRHARP
jgi:hypothetical protein